jgi:hypothetical protein
MITSPGWVTAGNPPHVFFIDGWEHSEIPRRFKPDDIKWRSLRQNWPKIYLHLFLKIY